jgi:hypothetical protein
LARIASDIQLTNHGELVPARRDQRSLREFLELQNKAAAPRPVFVL